MKGDEDHMIILSPINFVKVVLPFFLNSFLLLNQVTQKPFWFMDFFLL